LIKKIGTIKKDDLKKIKNNFNIGIGHSRWATHGKVCIKNTHPHYDNNKRFYVVHNGIIENYEELKKEIKDKFYSETDSEVIVKLVNQHKNLGFFESVKKTCKKLKGNFAFLIMDKLSNTIIAVKKGSPLVIGEEIKKNNKNFYLSSDIASILNYTKNIYFLEDNEIAILNDEIKFYCTKKNKFINKKIKTINTNYEKAIKGKFEHFMLKEINEQPKVIEETINAYYRTNFLFENYMNNETIKKLNKIKRIVILGCGTSWHSGLVAKYWFETISKISTDVEYASEFRYRNPIIEKNSLIIAISQSGETADTIAAINEAKRKKAKILSICNVPGSTIDRISDIKLYTRAGPEIGVASTKAFTTQLSVLFLLSVFFGYKNKSLSINKVKKHISELKKVPKKIDKTLKLDNKLNLIVKKDYNKKNALFLGRGVNYPIALEGALKLKEISYIHAEGYPAAEMKHGPIALIDKNMPSIFISVKDDSYEKIMSNIEEIKARKGEVIAICSKNDKEIKKHVKNLIYIENTSNELSPLITVIPLQLLAYKIAKKRKCNIDKPRNLAKSVTVE
ncbi:MAG: glutamine--fructose-6-phosphate transaminase (isomerizing), partial [Candidatus Woesearchaeota archaeon]